MLSDTHPEAEKVRLELIRKMTVAERIASMRRWTRIVVHLSRDGIAKANPGLGERELELLWVEYHYGRDLAARLRDDLKKRRSCNPATP